MERRQQAARVNSAQGRYWEQFSLKVEDATEDAIKEVVDEFYPNLDGTGALRDIVGGTLLHWCMLWGCGGTSKPHRSIAEYIINERSVDILNQQYDRYDPWVHIEKGKAFVPRGSKGVLAYEDLYYDGETALHIAVAKGDMVLAELLLKKKVSCSLRAYGNFFMPGGESGCYFGEYPLSFAASSGLNDMVELLVEYDKKSPWYRDSFSNTALHMAVLHNRMDTYKKLVTLAREDSVNAANLKGSMGMTPLALAALYSLRTGDKDPYDQILTTTRSVVWSFTDVTSYSYPLEQIDTVPSTEPFFKLLGEKPPEAEVVVVQDGDEEKIPDDMYIPILFLAIQYELLALADDDILVALMENKWMTLRYIFYLSILWHFAYLACLTCLTVLNHPDGREPDTWLDWTAAAMTVCGLLPGLVDIAAGVSYYRRITAVHQLQQARDASPQPPKLDDNEAWRTYKACEPCTVGHEFSFLKQLLAAFPISGFDLLAWVGYGFYVAHRLVDDINKTSSPEEAAPVASTETNETVLGEVPTEASEGSVSLTLVFLGMSTMCAWLSTLTYAPVHERTGMLVTMMTRTIFKDLLPFILVFSFILTGTAVGAYSLQRKGYNLAETLDLLKRLSIGVYDHGTYEPGGYGEGARQVSYTLILLYTLVSLVLMLNLLIATFTSTYEEVKDLAHKEWRLLWGRDLVMLERRCLLFGLLKSKLRVNHGGTDQHLFMSIKNVREDEIRSRKKKHKLNLADVLKRNKSDMATMVKEFASTIQSPQRPERQHIHDDNPPTPKKKKKKKKKDSASSPEFVKAPPMPTEPSSELLHDVTPCGNCGTKLKYSTYNYPVKVTCSKCQATTRLTAAPAPA